ncbi:MAG: caspase family protein [Bacteroidota bacterium]
MRSIHLSIALFTLCASFLSDLQGQERRALIVGINAYTGPSNSPANPRGPIKDLKGAVNDARAMQAILINRFQFNPNRIDTLIDQQATREGILNALQKLLSDSKPNEIAFFFYAGHGSQVKNSLSKERDQKDETIVPADAWKAGIKDIRDKELAAIYNQFLDKGVILTVIMDCCHSGSISRGPQSAPVYRYVEDADYDARDSIQPAPPEARANGNFLIMAAAQSDELAQEQPSPDQISHGAFTLSLTQALEQLGPNASTIQLFTSARAILKSNGKKQEPVIGGANSRQEKTLLGISKGSVPDVTTVAVMDDPKNPMTRKKVFLQGGFAVGIRKENELLKMAGKDTLAYLIVDSVYGPNRSHARLVKGDLKNLRAGEYLTVTNWVSSQAPLLTIYTPPALSEKQLADWVANAIQLKKNMGAKWVTELDKGDPDQSIYADAGGFFLNANGKRIALSTSSNATLIQSSLVKDRSLYIELPPPSTLVEAFTKEIVERDNRNIRFVTDPSNAHYWLIGTLNNNNQPAYRLRRAGISASDSLGNLPLFTNAYPLPSAISGPYKPDATKLDVVVDNLYDAAKNISKIRGWFQLAAPVNTSDEFPFDLVIRNKKSGEVIPADQYRLGDSIQLFLEAKPDAKKNSIQKRYVYLFMIDRDGQMQLLYPDGADGNIDNQFPLYRNGEMVRSTSLAGGTVQGPTGTDTYMLLATDEAIPNYTQVFNQEGVRAVNTPFALRSVLMTGMEGNTRSNNKTPTNWSLQRRNMVCVQ